jgi:hypothetical protein
MAGTTQKAATQRSTKPKAATLKSPTLKSSTPWGTAVVVERLTVPQRVGEKRFASLVELLETGDGEQLVRFAYSTDGVGRRGPVTLRARDIERLRKELARAPGLTALLAALGGEA